MQLIPMCNKMMKYRYVKKKKNLLYDFVPSLFIILIIAKCIIPIAY